MQRVVGCATKEIKSPSEGSGEVWISCEQAVNNFLAEPFVFTYSQEKEAQCPLADEVENYLYEPGASLLKAGPYRLLGARFGVKNYMQTVIFILPMH